MELLTEKKALLISREQWKWLADTGSTDKAYILREKGLFDVEANCMCCEYDNWMLLEEGNRLKNSCTFCPLENIAWGDRGDCLSKDSIFNVWVEGAWEDTPESKRIRMAAAADMVCSISYALREKGYE
jgi:hypothetical protein